MAEKRLELDYKKKMQLAFESLQDELLKQIGEYPDIKEKLKMVLEEFKQKANINEN